MVAGNVDGQRRGGRDPRRTLPHVLADNVVPRIGVLAPDSARAAIREMFLAHVIGGKHLSARDRLHRDGPRRDAGRRAHRRRAAGPRLDAERSGAGDVVVVDVGGATTDVHSVVELDPEDSGLAREVVAPTPVTRTVEGDLGMRWSAVTTVEAAGLRPGRRPHADAHDDPGFLPDDRRGARTRTRRSPRAAVGLALRRHAGRSRVVVSPEGRVVERTGKDLREVDLLVGSGGVLPQRPPGRGRRVLAGSTGDVDGGWQLPRAPRVVVDHDYVLAAAGLLAADAPRRGVPAGHAAHRVW